MHKIKLGISSCLLGNPVRYDGDNKLDSFLRDRLGMYLDYTPVCPEMECGMGVPREAIRLEGQAGDWRLITRTSRVDKTAMMVSWAKKRVEQLAGENLYGFIFKSNSPSCGMERVKVYNDGGISAKTGVGIFAGIFMEHFPLLPVEEEGRLSDPGFCENFIERVFTLNQWRAIQNGKASREALVDFHIRHKLLLLSHSAKHYSEMEELIASQKCMSIPVLFSQYKTLLMAALLQSRTIN